MAQNILARLAVQFVADTARLGADVNSINKKLSGLELSAKRLGNTLAGTFGAYYIVNGLQNYVKTLAEFDKQMASVRAITGATGKEFDNLTQSALQLGRSTLFTAKQVAELQVEFGRLGFSTKEILQSTKATISLATATGENLARSAEIAGSTLRAFQIDASQMGRVTDVMASSFNQSALALDSFADGIKYVAPVAKATQVSLEETAAMMSVLADAGIKGTQAGTSLRRIFTLLTADGKPLSERLDDLARKGITLAGANDEVGLYAQTALLVLANQNERVKELTESYRNANGETQNMADIMADNLAGDITKATNAIDALILSIGGENGLRSVIQSFTEYLDGPLNKSLRAFILDLNSGGKRVDYFKSELLKLQEQGFDISMSDAGIEILTRGLKNADEVAKKLKETLKEITDRKKNADILDATGDIDPITGLPTSGGKAVSGTEIQAKQAADRQRIRAEEIQNLKDYVSKYSEQLSIAAGIRAKIEEQFNSLTFDEMFKKEQMFNYKSVDGQDVTSDSFSNSLFGLLPPMEEVDSWFAETGETFDEFTDRILSGIDKNKKAWDFWGNAVSNVLDNVIAKDQNFAKSAAETTARIIDSTKTEIAAYLAKGAAKAFSMNPAAAGAIIAVGLSSISGLLKRFAKASDVNTRSNQSASTNFSITMRQRGTDLIGVIGETDRLNSRTRG